MGEKLLGKHKTGKKFDIFCHL